MSLRKNFFLKKVTFEDSFLFFFSKKKKSNGNVNNIIQSGIKKLLVIKKTLNIIFQWMWRKKKSYLIQSVWNSEVHNSLFETNIVIDFIQASKNKNDSLVLYWKSL